MYDYRELEARRADNYNDYERIMNPSRHNCAIASKVIGVIATLGAAATAGYFATIGIVSVLTAPWSVLASMAVCLVLFIIFVIAWRAIMCCPH